MVSLARIIVVALLMVTGAARAQSVTYDFTGTGTLCTSLQSGTDFTCDDDVPFTGSITMEQLAPGPSGPDSETDGMTHASDDNGWLQNSFVIRWENGSFVPGSEPGMQLFASQVNVWNNFIPRAEDPPRDRLDNGVIYDGGDCYGEAYMERFTTDLSWLHGVDFDLSARLAPGADATNVLNFNTISCGTSFYQRYGNIELTSLTPHSDRVRIDVRPHSAANYINPKSHGFVPVAVLGSAAFDATQVDPASTQFGPDHAVAVDDVHVADVNRDGYPDVVLRFRIQDAGIRPGQHVVTLSGRTYSGDRFVGMDRIRTPGHW